jgi:hypothetical protein
MTDVSSIPSWWAKGLLFENCNCTVVCPGHVHFDQLCTHERCRGFWAIRFRDGELGDADLAGVDAVVAYDSPQHMIAGGWSEVILIDDSATDAQAEAVQAILAGTVGGPWAVLDRFVETRLPTRRVSIRIGEEERVKRIQIEGVLESTVEAIRGRDRSAVVTFENMFNQVHAPSQVIAKGTTRLREGALHVETHETHGLWSDFHWVVSGE